jgi:hypothetical protein
MIYNLGLREYVLTYGFFLHYIRIILEVKILT